MIRILYFGNLPGLLGRTMEEIELPAGIADVDGLLKWLAARGEKWSGALGIPEKVKVTVNRQFAAPATLLRDGEEVAFVAFIEGP